MVLTARQKEEVNWAILQYMQSASYERSAEVFREEATVKEAEKSDADLLEKKWLSIVRLSKKVVELE
jgi:platelet-activating factor acetylhydrolase IB subunit alpha